VVPSIARLLAQLGCSYRQGSVHLADAGRLEDLARAASAEGAFRLRGEAFDVRETFEGPVIARIDRGGLPVFGIAAQGVHLNGLVARPDGLHLWVARRARTKPLDPGKLDHLVAGGISAGMTPFQTLLKEAEEEAGLPADLTRQAIQRGTLDYAITRPEGLRRDRLHLYDLMLPETFQPEPRDGEVEGFELWPIRRAFEAVRETDEFKFNVKLVLIDLFGRLGMAEAQPSDVFGASRLG